MKHSALLVLLLALLAPACETVVEIDVPQKDGLLVLNGFLIADQLPILRLTRSQPVFDNGSTAVPYVNGASVALYEDGVYVGPLEELFAGEYYYDTGFDSLFAPKPERSYRVDISHPDFPPASAEMQLPPSSIPVSVQGGDTVLLGGEEHLEVLFQLDDPAWRADYYSFELFLEAMFFGGQLCFRNTEENFEGRSDFFPDIGALPSYCSEVFLTDESFNGTTKEIRFLIPLENLAEVPMLSDARIRVVVSMYSEALCRYNLSAQLQADNEGNPFAQPVVVDNNVVGGFGIFGGISAVQAVLDL